MVTDENGEIIRWNTGGYVVAAILIMITGFLVFYFGLPKLNEPVANQNNIKINLNKTT